MENLTKCKNYLNSKLKNMDSSNFEDEYCAVLNIVARTIEFGLGDSVLIMGPPGCGKGALLEKVLKEIKQNKKLSKNHVLVELHGLVHTDENVTFRDIVRQLNMELLSGDNISGTSSDMLSHVLLHLKSEHKDMSIAVVFVLHGFEYFCTQRHKTLIYNLLDATKSEQTPVCVIGTTSDLNVTKRLEKRLKSRFSPNEIILWPSNKFEDRVELFRSYLSVSNKCGLDSKFVRRWNENVNKLAVSNTVSDILRTQLAFDTSERKFCDHLFLAVSLLTEDDAMLSEKHINNAYKLWKGVGAVTVLESLSVLELCMVIAMNHHVEVYGREPATFEAIYQRYVNFTKRNPTAPFVGRPVAIKCFESLQALKIISKVGGSHALKMAIKENASYELLLTSDQIKEGIKNCKDLPTEVVQWAGSSLEIQ